MQTEEIDLRDAYNSRGHAVMKAAAPPDVAQALLGIVWKAVMQPGVAEKLLVRPGADKPTVNTMPSYEFYGSRFPLVLGFHWGLTSKMCDVTGVRLAPTYSYFRTYQKGDICTVHADRDPCEHSASLALSYSDGIIWDLDVGAQFHDPALENGIPIADDFSGEPFTGVKLASGDALIYKGVNHRHGRIAPNPNRWSAHLFMHWVDLDGPYAEWAFNKHPTPAAGEFTFPKP